VESNAQRSVLIDTGCDFLQGYLFGRPGPLEPSQLGVAAGAA